MAQTAEERAASMREHRRNWKARHREQSNAMELRRQNERYATDPEYRERKKARSRADYNIESHRERTYGLSHEQFVEMYARQNGRCASCRDEITPSGKSTHVDHNHATGQVRGLLCRNCNVALGHLKDDPQRARALAAYLEGGDAT